jgi:hypothetical protein
MGGMGGTINKNRALSGAAVQTLSSCGLVIHAAHAAHSTATAAAHGGGLGFGEVGDGALGRQHEAGNAGCVLEGGAGDLGRVDDAGFDHVDPFHLGGIEADALFLALRAVGDDCAVYAGVLGYLADRLLEGSLDDLVTDFFVVQQLV